ncbi:hypothetical protein [Streptomyces sp. NPDC018000]|uniref:hypothetical protein n=1 Tax=Streptomyces sp. NPDC018000 TaxID=3365028 RepID=UPI003798FA36
MIMVPPACGAAVSLDGVDRDPMAVELAKLSLWLVTLAKGRPFSFLDHALRCADSLAGVIDVEQIKAFHLESGARQLSQEVSRALDVTETLLSKAADLRREIEATPVHDIRSVHAKTEKLREAEALSERLRLAADAVVGAALAAEGISDEEASDLTGKGWSPRRWRRSGPRAAPGSVGRTRGSRRGASDSPSPPPPRPRSWTASWS